ncbi:hypothetical protein TNCV_2801871 [Trichonephila clavipes]|nr:hypothetical protein TNCV_2801871 [Trichonephila clavipes]
MPFVRTPVLVKAVRESICLNPCRKETLLAKQINASMKTLDSEVVHNSTDERPKRPKDYVKSKDDSAE